MKTQVIITGSSGLVGDYLVPLILKKYEVISIDQRPGRYTNLVSCISNSDIKLHLSKSYNYIVIHLAAARFDHGISSEKYFTQNVGCTKLFLENIKGFKINYFLHYSSVAAIQGEQIKFNNRLNCDDAYRSTKYSQSCLIEEFCLSHNIPFAVLLPSAIYSDEKRTDTNISKLKNLSKILPFIPKIDVSKSLTSLNNLCEFTVFVIINSMVGKYLVIDYPTNTVTQIILNQIKRKKIVLNIYFLREILFIISFVTTKILCFNYLTLNRVRKLFTDTSYESHKKLLNYEIYYNFIKNTNE